MRDVRRIDPRRADGDPAATCRRSPRPSSAWAVQTGRSWPRSRRPGQGETTLSYTYETPFGSLYPNTKVELGFRLTFADGKILDSPTTTIVYADDRFEWKTIEGPLVRVHWTDGR